MDTRQRLSAWTTEEALEHWLPILTIFATIMVAIWTPDGMEIVIVSGVALLIGLLLQPRHLWLVWLASVVSVWIAVGVWELFNEPAEPTNPENQETIVSFFFESFLFMAIAVLPPLWIGRLGRAELDDWLDRRHRRKMLKS